MANVVSKIADLINPEVMADIVQAQLTNAIRFSNTIAEIDNSLVARPGDTVTIPVWAYIGNAADLAEGVASEAVLLEASSTTATVKKAVKTVELSDEAVLAGYGDPIGEASRQLGLAIAGKVDADVLTAAQTSTLTYGVNTDVIDFAEVVGATMVFDDEEVGTAKYLFVNPAQYGELLLDDKFIVAAPEIARTGIVGSIAGCDVIPTKQLADGSYIVAKPGAVKIYMKKDVNLETQRNLSYRTTIISADEHYVAVLADASKVVKGTCKPTA